MHSMFEGAPHGLSFGNRDLWDRMRGNFQLPTAEDNPKVAEQVNWFMNHRQYLTRTTQRAAPYMYQVYQQVEARDLPAELVLLPVIESAYNPYAYSGAGAAGLWQLMPGTARHLGLKHNLWYDGRRDIFASTNAALNYLTYLEHYFNGNWLLAVAAYDAGEGTVQEAIRRNARLGRNTDFWSLPLPQETRSYVPRLLALAKIIRYPDRYPVALPAIDDEPYLGQVDVSSQIKLADAAKFAGISLNQLKQLNPGYKRPTTNPRGPSTLLLPISSLENFKQNLASRTQGANTDETSDTEDDDQVDDSPPPPVRHASSRYTLQRGDSLSKVAHRYHVTVAALQRANPNVNAHALKPGKVLVIPTRAVAHSSSGYKVRHGDTLSGIAKRFGISVARLKEWNHLTSVDLHLGQMLRVS
jgi:membrane-bound lytic murein transglycosylase D